MKQNKILCAIPCFNESYNLPKLFTDLKENRISEIADIVFVDDCSSDETYNLIQSHNYPVIRHQQNGGYGKAVQTGFRYAVDNRYDGFVIFPGDNQRSAKDLQRLVQLHQTKNYDVVVGSKFHIYSDKYGPIKRRIGNIVYSKIASYCWKSPIQDVLSGFKIYSVEAVLPFFFDLPEGYPFDICFSFYASKHGLTITEVPVNCRYDEHTSKMKSVIGVSIKMLVHLVMHMIIQPLFRPARKSNARRISADRSA